MIKYKNVFVFGMARSGYEVSKLLKKYNNDVILFDSNKNQDKEHIKELKDLGVELHFEKFDSDLLDSIDLMVKNPGIKDDNDIIIEAKNRDIPIINEIELSYYMIPKDVKIVAITGTNGKTTTTSLTYEILSNAFPNKVHLAGNIGIPLCSIITNLKHNDIIVMEFSCQQSVNITNFKPDIAVLTNFSPAHIDFFGSYDKYKDSKMKIFLNQDENCVSIFNYDNKDVMEKISNVKSNMKFFSTKCKSNIYYSNGDIYYDNKYVISSNDIKIPGIHNVENVMCAISVAKEFKVSNDIIRDIVKSYTGVRHRLEYIDTIKNADFYNDTEATNIKSTQIALSSFEKKIILILGGLDRGQNFNELKPYIKNVKYIIGIGECRDRVKTFADTVHIENYIFEYLKDGFEKIKDLIFDNSIVLLSPASASWDQYKECEIRGDEFVNLVRDWSKEMSKIKNVIAREVLDSRGNPTVEVDVILESGILGRAIVPSGASTGEREALELRDNDSRYMGKGVLKAVKNVNTTIKEAVIGMDSLDQIALDRKLIELDGTKFKSNLGANAILGVSMANLKAAALYNKMPLYEYVGDGKLLPNPMMNIVNGGAHADNPLDIQEFMIMPIRDSIKERVRVGAEVFHNLKKILKEEGMVTAVGDEGGFAPNISSNEEAIKYIIKAIEKAGYKPGKDVNIALDVAASTLYSDGFYHIEGKELTNDELIDYYEDLVNKYPIVSIEDPVDENDWEGFRKITDRLGNKIQIVGDDLFVTNKEYLQKGIDNKSGNAILLKVNQIGTITETLETIKLAKDNGYKTIISHRSGETEDTIIAHLAVGLSLGQIKTGSLSRTDRICKYNELMRIEEEIIAKM